MNDLNPAHRFKLATKIESLAAGTKIIHEQLGACTDDVVVEALERLEREVGETLKMARAIAAFTEGEVIASNEYVPADEAESIKLTPAEVEQIRGQFSDAIEVSDYDAEGEQILPEQTNTRMVTVPVTEAPPEMFGYWRDNGDGTVTYREDRDV